LLRFFTQSSKRVPELSDTFVGTGDLHDLSVLLTLSPFMDRNVAHASGEVPIVTSGFSALPSSEAQRLPSNDTVKETTRHEIE